MRLFLVLLAPLLLSVPLAASTLPAFSIFPIPWEPSHEASPQHAPVLSFANLPAGASVRIHTLAGALVWRANAAADGTLTWNGRNLQGSTAASGTYIAIVESQGRVARRRFVILR